TPEPATPTWDLPPTQPPPARRKSHGRKLLGIAAVVVVGALGVLLTQVPGTSKMVRGLFASSNTGVITSKVTRGRLPVTFKERAGLERCENLDVFNKVEGQLTIISILPEGTRVKKGDLVCELDSSALRDNLVNQKIQTEQAEAAHQNAVLTLEVAKIAV